MFSRLASLTLVFLALTAMPACAAPSVGDAPTLMQEAGALSRYDGTYAVASEGTFWSDGKLPEGFRLEITIRFADGKLHYHSVNTTDPAAPMTLDYAAPLDGTPVMVPGQARYDAIAVLQTGPHSLQILKLRGTDVIIGEYWSFAPAGGVLVRRGVAKAPDTSSRAYQETFTTR